MHNLRINDRAVHATFPEIRGTVTALRFGGRLVTILTDAGRLRDFLNDRDVLIHESVAPHLRSTQLGIAEGRV